MGALIEVENLKKVYKDAIAVDGISFEIYPGEVLAFLGPNGAGKTTTVEILLGIRKKTAGRLIYFGKEINRPRRNHLKRIGATLQEERFLPNLTPREILHMFASLYGKGDVDEAIKTFAIDEFANRRYRHLSGGQKRRLSLAVATVHDPDVVFLDEPTTGLDVQSRRSLYDYILKMRDRGKAVFLTTHYIEEAERLADRVIIIDHGHIVAHGRVDELIRQAELPTILQINGDTYEVFSEREIASIVKSYEEIRDLSLSKPTLEDVFVKLTGRRIRD